VKKIFFKCSSLFINLYNIICLYTFIHYIYICYFVSHQHSYTGCRRPPVSAEYLKNWARQIKIFQTKVVRFQVTHYMAISIWSWRVLSRSREGHLQFLKWNPLFFITYSCSLSRELSKTLHWEKNFVKTLKILLNELNPAVTGCQQHIQAE